MTVSGNLRGLSAWSTRATFSASVEATGSPRSRASTSATSACSERFIATQAFGAVILEGHEVKMSALPAGWRCRHGGDLDDPDFNNRHVEVGPA